jgi:hypothetical protein
MRKLCIIFGHRWTGWWPATRFPGDQMIWNKCKWCDKVIEKDDIWEKIK